jgi:hypothetical protein
LDEVIRGEKKGTSLIPSLRGLLDLKTSNAHFSRLFELWRIENPSDAEYRENVAAIRESLEAMEAGRLRPLADFDAEFRKRHGITSDA